jgi:hypothetical protein
VWGGRGERVTLRAPYARASALIALPRLMGRTPSQPSRGLGSAGDDEHKRQHRDRNRNDQRETGIHSAFLPLQPRSHTPETGKLVAPCVFSTCWRRESQQLLPYRAKTWTGSYLDPAKALEAAGLSE